MLGYRKRMAERAASLGHGHSQEKNNLSVQQCYHLHWPCAVELKGLTNPILFMAELSDVRSLSCEICWRNSFGMWAALWPWILEIFLHLLYTSVVLSFWRLTKLVEAH